MKRFVAVLCVVAFVVALPLSHVAAKGKPDTKVAICHVNSANDILDLGSVTVVFGKLIEVSENALEKHLAHGDSDVFYPLDESTRDLVEELYGISLPNADCYFVATP